jgi:cyclophilin family peptidyl-prolyl cis-trans isomerase
MAKQWSVPPEMSIDPNKQYTATLNTSKGAIKIKLLADEAPRTVNNFVFLAREGFYEGVPFHRVIRTFMIQTGDPTGTGSGGPGYRFADELPPKHSYEPGMVAMANAGPDTNGSQFFICSGHDARSLDRYPNYTQFGRVIEGMDVVQALAGVPVGPAFRGEVSKPQEAIQINSVTIDEQ